MAPRRKAPEPETLVDACESGDLRRSLEALRRSLTDAIGVCPVDSVAPLTARLESVLVRLSEMETPEVSRTDELRVARERRREAEVSADTSDDGVKRGRGGRGSR